MFPIFAGRSGARLNPPVGQYANGIGACGDSVVAGAYAYSSPIQEALLRSALDPGYLNAAVGGTRTDQIAAQIPTVLAAKKNTIAINGGINDIAQSIALATRRANWVQNVRTILAAGARPVTFGFPPTNTSANVPAYCKDEVYQSLWCLKNNVQRVDFWSKLATAAGGYTAGLNGDAIHPNHAGALLLYPEVVQALQTPGLRTSYPLLALTDTASDAGTFLGNTISLTDSNADGLANSYNAYDPQAQGVAAYSIQNADANGFGKWQRCTFTGAAGPNGVGFNGTAVTLASLGWSIGDKIAAAFRVRSPSTGISLNAYVTGITSTGNQPLFQSFGDMDYYAYQELVITGGTAINLQFFATGTGYFEVNRPIIVNLTQLGLA